MPLTSAAVDLARWAEGFEPEPGDLELADRSLLDTVAVTLAARDHRVTRLAASLPDGARWAVAGHVLDFDDLHMPSTTHVSAVCVPTALATGGGPRAYLAAAGVMARLGTALGWRHYAAGWHATCTAGAPASAAGAAVALGLPADKIAVAMALAVPVAGGVQRAFGTDAKSLQVGFAVEAGIRAARLAAAGAQADPAAVDAWLGLVGGEPAAVDPSGPVIPNGLAVKLYPCCYALQRPISAISELAGPELDPAEIRRIVLRTPEATVVPLIHHRPQDGLQGKFSLEYAAAAALLAAHAGPTPASAASPTPRSAGMTPGGWSAWSRSSSTPAGAGCSTASSRRRSTPAAGRSCGPASSSRRVPRRGLRPRPSCGPSWPTACAGLTPTQRRGPGKTRQARSGGGYPMDELNEDERAMVELVRDFVNRDVRPVVRELEHANTYPEKLIEQMKQLGVFGLAIPEPWGEAQVSTSCYALITEQLARGWMSLAGAMGGHTVVAKLLLAFGTEEQKRAYLPRMATGELRATMALTEPGGGSDLQAIRTAARRDGACYVINGSKTWITNARRSGLVALLCKTDPAARPAHAGISIMLAEPGPGFTVSRDLPKLGYKGVESCELTFTDFRVPGSALLGEREGEGFAQMMRGLEIGRIQVASRALGVGQAALDDALRYAQQREAFGKPIWKHQSIGNYLADMVTKLTAARQLILYAARCYDSGRRADMEAGMAKLFASETAMEIALDAVRIHGGYGYSTEFDVERYFRDAPLMIVGEGTNEIQRNVIARQLIQRYPAGS